MEEAKRSFVVHRLIFEAGVLPICDSFRTITSEVFLPDPIFLSIDTLVSDRDFFHMDDRGEITARTSTAKVQ